MTSIAHHHLRCGAVQVVQPPLLQVHAAVMAADVNLVQCTQIPLTDASTGLKRMRKERQCQELADSEETTPKPHTRSKSKKMTTAECGLVHMTLQTPMPESDAPNELGPPPPDSTPAPKHGYSCSNSTLNNTWGNVAVSLQEFLGFMV